MVKSVHWCRELTFCIFLFGICNFYLLTCHKSKLLKAQFLPTSHFGSHCWVTKNEIRIRVNECLFLYLCLCQSVNGSKLSVRFHSYNDIKTMNRILREWEKHCNDFEFITVTAVLWEALNCVDLVDHLINKKQKILVPIQ